MITADLNKSLHGSQEPSARFSCLTNVRSVSPIVTLERRRIVAAISIDFFRFSLTAVTSSSVDRMLAPGATGTLCELEELQELAGTLDEQLDEQLEEQVEWQLTGATGLTLE